MNDAYGYPIIANQDKIVNPDLTQKEISGVIIEPKQSFFSSTNITMLLLGTLYILMCYIAGYHAYTEYVDDPISLKWMRIIMAVIFMPFYIGYVLLKSFFVDFMKSNANLFDFSFFDYLLNIAFTR
jgi:uncharacterized membrane protein (DUF485 family)